MIYRNSYFKKELRQAYVENKIGNKRKMAFAFFLGLISFAIYFVFQTLRESVLSDVIPEIMQPSFFSTVYIYIHMAFLLNTVYFIIYYDYLFFAEIRKNAWYLLVQMGYSPIRMIFSKIAALLYSAFLIYSIGFIFTVFLTFFLKYTLVFAYIPVLYAAGLIDILLLVILSMIFSLYVRTIINGQYTTFFSAVLIMALKMGSGYYGVLSNRVSMQDINNLLDFRLSLYLPMAAVISIICGLICVSRARNIAKYYYVPNNDYPVPAGVSVVHIDPKTGKAVSDDADKKPYLRNKILRTLSYTLIIAFICAALVFNIFIIVINASTPGNEVTIRGVIPLIFKSDTMEPAIMLNDLVYFQKIDTQYVIEKGQIILFEENNIIYVERVTEKAGDSFKVDIDNYPPMSQTGAMVKTVPRQAVHGVHKGNNRWLGALILFANTIIGRLVLLMFPAVLLFYQKQIIGFAKRKK